ncbi:hypothetical protein BD410DRAFT_133225 [Rickenella mellea]|uniref:Uncharacterized protein n=1 Tax=Rickenella mellea TaxID=50990 RepID=A0A4Y7Q996_9AGAM|nr:hypothetical protein BD410DRAFT_133225 [Rickenella mellea]
MHLLLVIVHIALLILSHFRVEHTITFQAGNTSNVISTRIVQISQVIGTLYATGLVAFTQKLALRRNMLTRQTLTRIHDKTAAWTGLGSSLLVLQNQFLIAASVLGIFAVALYLGCMYVLHITTPALISVDTFNQSVQTVVKTTRGAPSINYDDYDNNLWSDVGPLHPYLQRLNESSTLGLHNATVYDVLRTPGVGNATVNATTFDVSCGSLSNATVTPDPPTNGNNVTDWFIRSVYSNCTFGFDVKLIGQQVVKFAASVDSGRFPLYLGSNAVFYASINLTDSDGNIGSTIPLNPPIPTLGPISEIDSVQIMGCTLSLIDQAVVIDAETGLLLSLSLSAEKTQSKWREWLPPVRPNPPLKGPGTAADSVS